MSQRHNLTCNNVEMLTEIKKGLGPGLCWVGGVKRDIKVPQGNCDDSWTLGSTAWKITALGKPGKIGNQCKRDLGDQFSVGEGRRAPRSWPSPATLLRRSLQRCSGGTCLSCIQNNSTWVLAQCLMTCVTLCEGWTSSLPWASLVHCGWCWFSGQSSRAVTQDQERQWKHSVGWKAPGKRKVLLPCHFWKVRRKRVYWWPQGTRTASSRHRGMPNSSTLVGLAPRLPSTTQVSAYI